MSTWLEKKWEEEKDGGGEVTSKQLREGRGHDTKATTPKAQTTGRLQSAGMTRSIFCSSRGQGRFFKPSNLSSLMTSGRITRKKCSWYWIILRKLWIVIKYMFRLQTEKLKCKLTFSGCKVLTLYIHHQDHRLQPINYISDVATVSLSWRVLYEVKIENVVKCTSSYIGDKAYMFFILQLTIWELFQDIS